MYIVVNDFKNGGQTKLSDLLVSSIPDFAMFRVYDTKDGVVESIFKSDIIACLNKGLKFCSDIIRDFDFANWFLTTMTKARVVGVDMHEDLNFKSKIVDLLNNYNRRRDKEFEDLRFYFVDFGEISKSNGFYLRFYNDHHERLYIVMKDGVFRCINKLGDDYYFGTLDYDAVIANDEGVIIRYLSKNVAAECYIQFYDFHGKFLGKRKYIGAKKVTNRKGSGLCLI